MRDRICRSSSRRGRWTRRTAPSPLLAPALLSWNAVLSPADDGDDGDDGDGGDDGDDGDGGDDGDDDGYDGDDGDDEEI